MNKKWIILFPLSLIFLQNSYSISVKDAQMNYYENERIKNELPHDSDQGSLAHERWNKFDKLKIKFEKYKNIHENIYLNTSQILDTIYFKSVKEKLLEYYASLIIIEEMDKKYFQATYQGKNAQTVYLETISQFDNLFIECINQSIYNYLFSFEKKYPTVINKIEFYSWFKAYFPSMNREHRAGFEPAHYYSDSFYSLFNHEIFRPFLLLTDNENYDFKISEISFGEYWDNANLKPYFKKITSEKKYKFKFNNDIELVKNFIDPYQIPSLQIIHNLKNKRSLIHLKLKANNFYSSIIKLLNSTPNKTNILNSKKNNAITKNLIWSQQFNLNYLQPHKITASFNKNCLSILESNDLLSTEKIQNNLALNATACSILDKSQDWIIIFEKMSFKGFRIYSASYPGYCLNDSNDYGLSLITCNKASKSQIWIYNRLPNKMNALINTKTKQFLKISGDLNNQTWMFQYTKSNLDQILYSLINKKEIYSLKDWSNGNKIKNNLAYAINVALFINKYKLISHSDLFFNKVIASSWFQDFDYKTKQVIEKIAKNKFSEISETDITATLQNLNFIAKLKDKNNINSDNLILKNINNIHLNELIGNTFLSQAKEKPKSLDKIYYNIQNSISEINHSLLKYRIDDRLSHYKISLFYSYVPLYIVPNDEEAAFNRLDPYLQRFFDMVDECDHWLPNFNNERMPTYRQVWENWSNGSWDPDEEFQQLFDATNEIRSQLTPNQFANIFRRVQELTLRDYSADDMSASSFDSRSLASDLSSLYEEESEISFWSSNINSPLIFEPDELIEPISDLMENAEYSMINLESFMNSNELASITSSLETTSVSTILTIIPVL